MELKKYLTPKNIFIALGVFIAVELIWALISVSKNTDSSSALPNLTQTQPNVVKPTIISLTADETTLKISEQVLINVNLSSDKKADGVDLIITFDPKMLEVVLQNDLPIKTETLFKDYPQNKLDSKNGRVTVSGITEQTGGILANGLFGSIIFKAKSPGIANVGLDFTKASTVDTNVIQSGTGKDILEKVVNLEFNILP